MSDLDRLREWLKTYPGAEQLAQMNVDYTDALPGQFGVFPSGLVEISRRRDIVGDTTVQNQYNFAIYIVFPKSPGDDAGALINADWVMDFQKWVQEQSITGKAPTFGNYSVRTETMSAQNGALYEADAEGLAMYMVQLSAVFTNYYEGSNG